MIGDFRNRRRNFFIRKRLQGLFMARFAGLVIIAALIAGGIVYMASSSTVTTVFENARLRVKSTAEFLLPALLLSTVSSVVIVGSATVLMALFMTHRIAGPLYRMERDIEDITAGDLRVRFNLRKGDELKAFAAVLNNMLEILRVDLDEMKALASKVGSLSDARDENAKRLMEKINKYRT